MPVKTKVLGFLAEKGWPGVLDFGLEFYLGFFFGIAVYIYFFIYRPYIKLDKKKRVGINFFALGLKLVCAGYVLGILYYYFLH